MEYSSFPDEFPDVGGMSFKEVSENPEFAVFCAFVTDSIKNCTGLFLEFQRYLLNKDGFMGTTIHESDSVPKPDSATGN